VIGVAYRSRIGGVIGGAFGPKKMPPSSPPRELSSRRRDGRPIVAFRGIRTPGGPLDDRARFCDARIDRLLPGIKILFLLPSANPFSILRFHLGSGASRTGLLARHGGTGPAAALRKHCPPAPLPAVFLLFYYVYAWDWGGTTRRRSTNWLQRSPRATPPRPPKRRVRPARPALRLDVRSALG